MARVQIDLPERFDFALEMQVRRSDENSGGHLGNHMLVAYLNEACFAFVAAKGLLTFDEGGVYLINADLAVSYLSEAFHADVLRIEVAASDFHKYGCDFVYRVTNRETDRMIATAKTGMICFDPRAKKAVLAPDSLLAALAG